MKVCVFCGEVKPLAMFPTRGRCKLCKSYGARKWRQKNPDKVRESGLKWRLKNPDKVREKSRKDACKWRIKNPNKARESVHKSARKWRQENQDKINAKSRNRRVLQSSAGDGTVTAGSIASILAENGGMCVYCELRGRTPANKATTLDHIVPIALGGAHSVHNLCGACGSCNSSKHKRLLADWVKSSTYSLKDGVI